MGMATWILDNGHGKETPGKRSPKWKSGGQLFEYEFNRDVVLRIHAKLMDVGINSIVLVPEIEDISLKDRCNRIKEICSVDKDCILLSIHANAGGGTGWEA